MNFDTSFFAESFVDLWRFVPLTLELTALSYIFGFFIGLLFALILKHKVKGLYNITKGILSVLRGTPAILQLYIIYYSLPLIIQAVAGLFNIDVKPADIPTLLLIIITLGLNRSAYLTATITSGLNAINHGEVEAGLTIGMTTFQVLRIIIIPATIKVSLRNLSTNLINLLHGTSIAFFATLIEITGEANILAQDNWKYFETYIAAGIIYWILTIIIEVSTHYLDNHFHRYERKA